MYSSFLFFCCLGAPGPPRRGCAALPGVVSVFGDAGARGGGRWAARPGRADRGGPAGFARLGLLSLLACKLPSPPLPPSPLSSPGARVGGRPPAPAPHQSLALQPSRESAWGECKPTPRLVVLFSLFFLVIKPDEVACLQFPLRAVIFPRRDKSVLGRLRLHGGGGDVEYFENYSFLVVSRGSREPGCARSAQPEEGGLKAGQGFWGVSGRGVRGFFFSFFFFAPAALSACRTRGDLGQPRPELRGGGGISGGRGVCILGAA